MRGCFRCSRKWRHQRSADHWFRIAILSSTADAASPFFHLLLAKGEAWSDPQMLVALSSLIGTRRQSNEISQWFGALGNLRQPDKALEGLARGLKLAGARNLKVPGVEQAISRLLTSRASRSSAYCAAISPRSARPRFR